MFLAAIVLLLLGYALAYTGVHNQKNGGQGPTLWEALGLTAETPSTQGLNATPQSTTQAQTPTFEEL